MNLPSQWNKPPRSQQSCANCNAFEIDPNVRQVNGQPRQGICCGALPTLIQGAQMVPGSQLTPQGAQMQPALYGAWPPTNEKRWCRAWEPRDEPDTH